MRWARAWALPTARARSRRSGADTASTTRTSRSASSPANPTQGFGSTRSHRTDEWHWSSVPPGPASRRIGSSYPPLIDPAINLGGIAGGVDPDGLTLPRFQNWSVTYQRQVTDNTMLDLSYIGNRGSRLNHHSQTLGVDANMNHPDVLTLGSPCCSRTSTRRSPARRTFRFPTQDSMGTWRRRCGNFRSTKPSIGAVCPLGAANTTRSKPCSSGASLAGCRRRVGYTFSKSEEQRFRGWAWQRRPPTAVSRIPPIRSSGGERRRHAARAPDRIHLGSAGPEDGSRAAGSWAAGTSRHHALRKRPAAEHHHEQRSRRAALQQPEATQQDRH